MRWHCRWCGAFDTEHDGALGRAQAADHYRLLHPDLEPDSLDGVDWMDDAPRLAELGKRPRRFTRRSNR